MSCCHVVGDGEAVEVVFPWHVGRPLVSTRHDYLERMPALRRRGLAVRARVVRREPSADLALLEVPTLPEGAASLPVIAARPPVGTTTHLVGNRHCALLWCRLSCANWSVAPKLI